MENDKKCSMEDNFFTENKKCVKNIRNDTNENIKAK